MMPKGNPIVVIGIGGAGRNVLAQMGPTEGVTRVHVDTDMAGTKAVLAEHHIRLPDDYHGRAYSSLPEELHTLLSQICRDAPFVSLIAGTRGKVTVRCLLEISKVLSWMDVLYRPIIFSPFDFEPQLEYGNFVKEWNHILRHYCTVSLPQIFDLAGDKATLEDVLYRANWLAIELATRNAAPSTEGLLRYLSQRHFDPVIERYAGTINLVAEVDEISNERESHRVGTVTGVLSTSRLSDVQFIACGMCYQQKGSACMQDRLERLHADLSRALRLREAVVVSTPNYAQSSSDGRLTLIDPIFSFTGLPFENMADVIDDQRVTPEFYLP